MGAGRLTHHAINYLRMCNSRIDMMLLAQSMTNLGHISLSSYYTKQFPLPQHAPTLSCIHPPGGLGRHSWYNCPPSCSHPMEVSGLPGHCPDYPNIQLPLNPPPKISTQRIEEIHHHSQQSVNTHQFYCSHTLQLARPARAS